MENPKVAAQMHQMQEICAKMFSELVKISEQQQVSGSVSPSTSTTSGSTLSIPDSFELVPNPEAISSDEKEITLEPNVKKSIDASASKATTTQTTFEQSIAKKKLDAVADELKEEEADKAKITEDVRGKVFDLKSLQNELNNSVNYCVKTSQGKKLDESNDIAAKKVQTPEMSPEEIRKKCLKLFEESVQNEPVSVVLNTLGDFMNNCQEVFSDCEDDEDTSSEPLNNTHLRIGKLLTEMGAWAKELEKRV